MVNIIEKVKLLDLPLSEYIIVGTGIMGVLGLKKVHDIDIVVSPRLFDIFKDKGWQQIPYTYPDKLGKTYLKKNDIELYLDVNCGKFNPALSDLLKRAEVFEGVNFISIEDLVNFKREYNRPKDAKDLLLIKEYLNKGLNHQ